MSARGTMRRAALLLGLGALGACTDTPDPCAGYSLACIAVTVEDGPKDVYQLLVSVDEYSGTSPLTPRRRPEGPLPYPLRFAVRFSKFDMRHRGEVTLNVSALDGQNDVVGSLRQVVKIDNMEKQRVSLRLGAPFDLAEPQDLRPAPDLSEDLRAPADDLGAGLADGASGG